MLPVRGDLATHAAPADQPSEAIRSGNYRILPTKNRTLSDATRQSIAARSRVIAGGR